MANRWEKYFEPHIWKRGKEYYREGLVELNRSAANRYIATVYGSFAYDVEIELDGEELVDMSCTCPYAEDGNSCKHMAAVLMEIDDFPFGLPASPQPNAEELAAIIPEMALRSYIADLMKKDPALYQRILLQYGPSPCGKKSCADGLQAELELIFDEYEDRHGYIGYRDAYNFACDIGSFIETRVFSLSQMESPLAAVQLGWEAVARYCDCEVDDSDGGSGYVTGALKQLYKQVLPLCSTEEKRRVFQETITQYRDYADSWLVEETAYDLLVFHDWGEKLNAQVQEFLDSEILRMEAEPERNHWKLEAIAVRRMDMISDAEEQCAYMDAHLELPDIRIRRAERYFAQDDSKNAIRLLREGKEQAKEHRHYGSECQFAQLLIDAYETTGETKLFRAELENYILHYRQDDLNMLLRLKSHMETPEWETFRAQYFSEKGVAQKGELMRHEKMWDELLTYVQQSQSAYTADMYEPDLKGRCPGEMLAFYRDYLISAAERASNRNEYKKLMSYMKKLRTYPDGVETAAELAQQWRILYHRRPAMMDELRIAGF